MLRIIFLFCLLTFPLYSYEVRTLPPAVDKSQERVHYHSLAGRFANTLRNHPPVTDCQVHVYLKEFNDLEDHLEISIEIDRPSLITHLSRERNTTFITQRDQDRYLESFALNIKKSAHEVFSEIKIEAIKINLNIIE